MKQGVVDVMFILIDFLILYRRAALAREERKNDISKLLQFFQEMRTQNERFYYEIQLDENNVIQNVFWSHASQCAEYENFGDAVTFDTTYQTNIYRMLLAMFVRSNHQLQNVIFRQALLNNEQADTFEWLFKAFQNCMRPAKDPKCILMGNNSTCSNNFPFCWVVTNTSTGLAAFSLC
jgi:hypothetical protein